MTETRRGRWAPDRAGIVLGVAGSMAGNVAWAASIGSPVLVGVGVGVSLVLPVSVRLWRVTPTPEGKLRRAERVLVMSALCAGAAVYSLVHATLLLRDAGLPWSIAWLPAALMELLVVQAARAADAPGDKGTASRRDKRTPQAKAGTSRPTAPTGRPSPSRDSAPAASPAPPPAVPAERSGPRPVSELPASRPVPVPDADADDYAHLDEPEPADESPEDRRRRLDRNKKRRQRAVRKAEEEAS